MPSFGTTSRTSKWRNVKILQPLLKEFTGDVYIVGKQVLNGFPQVGQMTFAVKQFNHSNREPAARCSWRIASPADRP
jgi:hypothetical protein